MFRLNFWFCNCVRCSAVVCIMACFVKVNVELKCTDPLVLSRKQNDRVAVCISEQSFNKNP